MLVQRVEISTLSLYLSRLTLSRALLGFEARPGIGCASNRL
jgi:hypothetical protein